MNKLEIYLVGGAIRDKLLGLIVKEYDWVVIGSTTNIMLDLKFKQVGKGFPVFLHPYTNEEYALARKDYKIGSGYYGFECNTSKSIKLSEDLLRRDFTINSIALDKKGHLIDPYNGIIDLNKRKLKHVSKAFIEDPIRIFRLARFMSKLYKFKFFISNDTETLIINMILNGELLNLVPERILKEILYVFNTDFPYIFFKILSRYNALFFVYKIINRDLNFKKINIKIFNILNIYLFFISKYAKESDITFSIFFYYFYHIIIGKRTLGNYKKMYIKFIIDFCIFYRVSNSYRKFSISSGIFIPFYYRIFKLNNSYILFILTRINACRDKLKFIKLLFIAGFGIKYNLIKNNNIYNYFLLDIVTAINNINMVSLTKEKIKKNIHIEVIKKKISIINIIKLKYYNYL